MLTINIDIRDRLINDQVSEVTHIDIVQNTIQKVYVKFSDPQTGGKAMAASHFSRQHSWEGIEKSEAETPIKKGSTSPSIKRTQFHLALASAYTAYKVTGLSPVQSFVDVHLKKKKSFALG